MALTTNISTMEALFPKVEAKESLVRLAEATAERLRIGEWAGPRVGEFRATVADQSIRGRSQLSRDRSRAVPNRRSVSARGRETSRLGRSVCRDQGCRYRSACSLSV